MPRRPREKRPEALRQELVELLTNFEAALRKRDLRKKVLALVPAFHVLRDLGSSLLPRQSAPAARDRILNYFRKYPLTVMHGDELMVVSGIQDWPRRIRELRTEHGWSIASGVTVKEMFDAEEIDSNDLQMSDLKPEEYLLLDGEQDREAAYRWKLANEIRRHKGAVRSRILQFLRKNVGRPVTGEELRYVAQNKTEWARRVRELRTEQGWPVMTRNTGRPDLGVGVYLLEEDRQSLAHDRHIPDPVRRAVLVRDGYSCRECGWKQKQWNKADPRHLELHHIKPHVKGGENDRDNLLTLCTICHDDVHRGKSNGGQS